MADTELYDLYCGMGRDNLRQGRYDAALEQLTLAIAANDAAPQAYFLRGLCLHQAGRIREAAQDMRTAVDLGFPEAEEYYRQYRERIDANDDWTKKPSSIGFSRAEFLGWFLDGMLNALLK